MSDYCSNKACPACNLKRHMQAILDAGCPQEELMEMALMGLSEVVGGTVEMYVADLPAEEGTVH